MAVTKRVNIYAPITIYNITPPIHGSLNNVVMTCGDILKCLCRRAIVHEILPDGSLIRLTMKNYYTDNAIGIRNNTIVEENPVEVADINTEETVEDTSKDDVEVSEEINKEAEVVKPQTAPKKKSTNTNKKKNTK